MEYIEINCTINPLGDGFSDLLAAELVNCGYESFVETELGITAYIQNQLFNEDDLRNICESYSEIFTLQYDFKLIQDKNWNEEWEKNFEPVIVGKDVLIKGTFHQGLAPARFNITIDPKMSFGTGHHETTQLMIENLLQIEVSDKSVLDMGCGTGVLAILAAMRGATAVTAIDIEEWAYNNSIENIALNEVSYIEVFQGDAELIKGKHFDLVLANINKNVLLADIPKYLNCLNNNSILIVSGFYEHDLDDIKNCAESVGLKYLNHRSRKNWVSAVFSKI